MHLDEFEIRIRKKNGVFAVAMPEVCLFASGESIMQALANLDEKKKALQAELTSAGVEIEPEFLHSAQRQATGTQQLSIGYEIMRFTAKIAILLVFILVGSVFAFDYVSNRAGQAIYSMSQRVEQTAKDVVSTHIGRQYWQQKIENEIEELADPRRKLPEAQKQKILSQIKTIVDQWRPFVQEIMLIFYSPSANPASPKVQQNSNPHPD